MKETLAIGIGILLLAFYLSGCSGLKSVIIDETVRYAPLVVESLDPGPRGYVGEARILFCAGNLCAEAECYGTVSSNRTSLQCTKTDPYPRTDQLMIPPSTDPAP